VVHRWQPSDGLGSLPGAAEALVTGPSRIESHCQFALNAKDSPSGQLLCVTRLCSVSGRPCCWVRHPRRVGRARS
jgi:hypothetical protein